MTSSFEIFGRLRDDVDRAFRNSQYDHGCFAAIAEAALVEADLANNFPFDFAELTRWILEPDHVAPLDGRRPFSDLPFTVARGNGFYIEILLWTRATSSIHQHAFSGAFTVAQGSSIHSRFSIETLERISEGLQIVRGTLDTAELLAAGQVRRIDPSGQLSHSVFHLDEPTLSIVVRTNYEPWHMPQLTMLPPSYTYAPAWLLRDGQIDHLTRTFRVMSQISAPDFLRVACDRFADLDLPRAIALLADTIPLFLGPDLEVVVARFKEAHGRLADPLPGVVERALFEARVRRLRDITSDETERFALAAMMVAQDREQARQLLSQHPRGEHAIADSTIPAMAKLWAELGGERST